MYRDLARHRDGLRARGLADDVDLIVLSDHGMADVHGEDIRRRVSDLVHLLAERDYLLPLDADDSSIPGDVEVVFKHNLERELIVRSTEAGKLERYRVQEWLNFITSELHKGFSPLFRPNTPDAYKEIAKANLAAKFDAVEKHLAALKAAAEGTDNRLYPMKEALRAKATVGEVCNALRDVRGVYVPPDAF